MNNTQKYKLIFFFIIIICQLELLDLKLFGSPSVQENQQQTDTNNSDEFNKYYYEDSDYYFEENIN
jgi:hypothetical protein